MSTPEEFASAYQAHLKLKEETSDNIKVLRQMIKDSEKHVKKLVRELGQPNLFDADQVLQER